MTNNYRPPSPFDLSSPYGYRNDPKTKDPHKFHSGQDFRAPAGTPVPTAVSGVVVYSGFNDNLGNVVIIKNDTGDYSLYGHLQDGDRAKLGQRIWPGDTIGLVGNTGARTTGPHLHYSIISKDAHGGVENPGLSHDGGPIGVHLDERSTLDPAQYDNYDPRPRYLDEFKRAAEIMTGGNTSAPPGMLPPNRPGSLFFNPFNPVPAAGFAPVPNMPAASDVPANFADRFGKWAAKPFGELDNDGAPAPQGTPIPGKRSEADGDATVRVLSRVNLSPASGDAPVLAPASAPPLLGIFSGQPMRDHPVWPSIFANDDRSSPDDDELYQRWRQWLDA